MSKRRFSNFSKKKVKKSISAASAAVDQDMNDSLAENRYFTPRRRKHKVDTSAAADIYETPRQIIEDEEEEELVCTTPDRERPLRERVEDNDSIEERSYQRIARARRAARRAKENDRRYQISQMEHQEAIREIAREQQKFNSILAKKFPETPSRTLKLIHVKGKKNEEKEIVAIKIDENFRRIAREFYDFRQKIGMFTPSYFYFSTPRTLTEDSKILYFILSPGWGDFVLDRMAIQNPEAANSEKVMRLRKESAAGPVYSKLFQELDQVTGKYVSSDFSLKEARYRIGSDLLRVAGGRNPKGNYTYQDWRIIVTAGVIIALDMVREPKAKRYIAELIKKNTRLSFKEKNDQYYGTGRRLVTIEKQKEQNREVTVKKLKVREGAAALRAIGDGDGSDGNFSEYSADEKDMRPLNTSIYLESASADLSDSSEEFNDGTVDDYRYLSASTESSAARERSISSTYSRSSPEEISPNLFTNQLSDSESAAAAIFSGNSPREEDIRSAAQGLRNIKESSLSPFSGLTRSASPTPHSGTQQSIQSPPRIKRSKNL